MAAEAIKIRATAAKLYKETGDDAIEGYRTMPLDDLKTHIARIQKGGSAAPAKGKAAVNGAARPKGKTPTTTAPAKGKGAVVTKGKGSASTSAPAKSTSQKSSPPKGKAATGTAKRPTAAVAKGKATATKGKVTPAKGRTTATPAKGKTKTGTAKTTTARPRRVKAQTQGAVRIDNKAVDWKAEWGGGQNGKRADVMSALRRFKGDKAKVFDLLAPNARSYYKGRTKDEAERLLVWLIGRVAYDFVNATGQHESGTRAAYGTARDEKNVRRRELRAERAAEAAKAARAAKRAKAQGKAPAKGKTATARKGR